MRNFSDSQFGGGLTRLVLDLDPGHRVGEPVVQAGGVRARIVERSGVGLRGAPAGGDNRRRPRTNFEGLLVGG